MLGEALVVTIEVLLDDLLLVEDTLVDTLVPIDTELALVLGVLVVIILA